MKRVHAFTRLIVVFLLCSFELVAQDGSISGIILPENSDEPVPYVTVQLEKTNYGSVSDAKGRFEIEDVAPGSYTLIVTSLGYSKYSREVDVKSGEELNINVTVEEAVLDLPAVVVESMTLTGGSTGIRNIPGSAYFISPKQIQKFSYTDINRTLRAVPGINIQEEDGFGLRPNIGLRGTGVERSSKITVMEDGVLMAPAPYTAPAAYYFPTIGRMQAVEILKGSSQIKYGPYTTGGAINLISTQIPDRLAGKVSLFAGSFGSFNLHATAGNSHEYFGYSVETFQYKSDGFKVLDNNANTGFDKKDYLMKFRINTKRDARVYQSLTFKVGRTFEVSNETYLGLTEEDFRKSPYRRYAASQKDQMTTDHTMYQATHVLSITKKINITTTLYRTEFNRNWYKLSKIASDMGNTTVKIGSLLESPEQYQNAYSIMTGEVDSDDDALSVKANNRSYYSQGVQTVLGYNFETGKLSHALELGARIHEDHVDRFQWIDKYKMEGGVMQLTTNGTPGTESNRVEHAIAFASYFQYKLKYDKLTVIPGIRYENIIFTRDDYGKNDIERSGVNLTTRENQVDAYIPGVGADYKLNNALSVFAGVHKGFSPPGSKEDSKPEESINYELGTRYAKRSLSGEVVVFFNDYKNLLGSDLAAAGGGGSTYQFNGGEVQTKGLEFQLNYNLFAFTTITNLSAPISVVYTYTDAKFQNSFDSDFEAWGEVRSGDELPYIAHNQLSFLVGLESKCFGINLSGKYVDEMRTKAGEGEMDPKFKTDAQFIMDVSASYTMSKYASFVINVTNVTNEVNVIARRPAGLRPGMPRAFMLGIKVSF
ncbi:MAG TPA: TonB-dependent receptor [Flavobacteriales bacterium]|nr:TonB-dependent receptor [Flavobacteriales bacterium]